MAGELYKLKSARARALVCSEKGEAWLEENPSFIELADQLCRNSAPEIVLREHSNYIGSGIYSEVRSLAGAAIKISSPATGRKTGMSGPFKHENLIDQFRFLVTLGRYLMSETDRSITTPDQYLAFLTPYGSHLRVEEQMEGWISLASFVANQNLREQERDINGTVKGRILTTVRDPWLRLGLNDLGLEKREPLHSGNVLVPSSLDNLDETPLCIIDQPGPHHAYLGKLSVALTSNYGAAQELVSV